jgi:hypothetical protein
MLETFTDGETLARGNIVKDGRPNRHVRRRGDMVARDSIVRDGMVMGDDAG